MNIKKVVINAEDVPEHIRKEFEDTTRVNGFLKMDALSDEAQKFIQDQVISEEEDPEEELKQVERLNQIALLLSAGIRIYLELSDDLVAPYHIKEAREDLLELYNSCAKFARVFNKVDLEHSKCVAPSDKEDPDISITH